jgi:hypothetical protein
VADAAVAKEAEKTIGPMELHGGFNPIRGLAEFIRPWFPAGSQLLEGTSEHISSRLIPPLSRGCETAHEPEVHSTPAGSGPHDLEMSARPFISRASASGRPETRHFEGDSQAGRVEYVSIRLHAA